MEQLSCILRGKTVTEISWGNPELTVHELEPDHYTESDRRKIGGFLAIFGAIRGYLKKREIQIISVETKKLATDKVELLDPAKAEYFSSHDVLTAMLSKAVESSDEIMITMDARKRFPSKYGLRDGGNCLKQAHVPIEICKDPHGVRQTVNRGYHYEADQVSGRASWQSRVCIITSWASYYTSLEGFPVLCHLPGRWLLKSLPLFDTCIIFQLDDQHLGVLHNATRINIAPNDGLQTYS